MVWRQSERSESTMTSLTITAELSLPNKRLQRSHGRPVGESGALWCAVDTQDRQALVHRIGDLPDNWPWLRKEGLVGYSLEYCRQLCGDQSRLRAYEAKKPCLGVRPNQWRRRREPPDV